MSMLSTPIFENNIARIGTFRCPADHPDFTDTGPIHSGHLIVFPRTAVRITLPDREPVVADPNTVMFYNYQQEYRRELLSGAGDYCEWFAFAPAIIAAALTTCDPMAAADPTHPFDLDHAPSDPQSYLLQRLIVSHIIESAAQGERCDTLWLDEALLGLLACIIQQSYSGHRAILPRYNRPTVRRQAEIVRAVQAHLATTFTQSITLDDLATTVYLSPFELCRIFRAHTGSTIHHYLTQLRLRRALALLNDHVGDLTTVALELGYSSHSHFTSAFRRTFGVTPSRLCSKSSNMSMLLLEKVRKNLIV